MATAALAWEGTTAAAARAAEVQAAAKAAAKAAERAVAKAVARAAQKAATMVETEAGVVEEMVTVAGIPMAVVIMAVGLRVAEVEARPVEAGSLDAVDAVAAWEEAEEVVVRGRSPGTLLASICLASQADCNRTSREHDRAI